MTKSRPIIFNVEMVKAILDGHKTQTRRIIKSTQRTSWLLDGDWSDDYVKNPDNYLSKDCPYGKPGNQLWVRESFRAVNEYGGDEWTTYAYPQYKDGQLGKIVALEEDYFYKKNKWQSPLFMPKWASRITLEIKDIHVERLRDISIEDARKEGIRDVVPMKGLYPNMVNEYRRKFAHLWNSINAKRGYSWESNPWVWAITFERIDEPEE